MAVSGIWPGLGLFGWDEEGGLGFAAELWVDDGECSFYAFRGGVGDGDVFQVGFSDVDGEDGGGAGWGEVGEFFAAYGAEPAAVGDGGEAAVDVA